MISLCLCLCCVSSEGTVIYLIDVSWDKSGYIIIFLWVSSCAEDDENVQIVSWFKQEFCLESWCVDDDEIVVLCFYSNRDYNCWSLV